MIKSLMVKDINSKTVCFIFQVKKYNGVEILLQKNILSGAKFKSKQKRRENIYTSTCFAFTAMTLIYL